MLYYIKDRTGDRWKVREAISVGAAINAINMARASGSVGWKDARTEYVEGLPYEEWPVTVLADVHRVNSDFTEQQPYTTRY